MINRARTIKLMAACASLTLVAAACGSDSDDAATTEAPAAAEAPAATEAPVATEAPAATAEDLPMATEAPMSTTGDDATGAEMMEPSGPLCDAVPTDGQGSFAGMTDDPAATAASNNPVLSTLVTAVDAAGLVDTLNGDGPFTIFAPTNDAFAAIPPADLDAVLADKDLLTSILTYHVVAGESLKASDLATAGELTTVEGDSLMIGSDGTTVNGAHVVCSDVTTANATVHIIDSVLMPPAAEMSEDMSDSMTG